MEKHGAFKEPSMIGFMAYRRVVRTVSPDAVRHAFPRVLLRLEIQAKRSATPASLGMAKSGTPVGRPRLAGSSTFNKGYQIPICRTVLVSFVRQENGEPTSLEQLT
jgi:hypothetical protein